MEDHSLNRLRDKEGVQRKLTELAREMMYVHTNACMHESWYYWYVCLTLVVP